jgi:hypothetical protein
MKAKTVAAVACVCALHSQTCKLQERLKNRWINEVQMQSTHSSTRPKYRFQYNLKAIHERKDMHPNTSLMANALESKITKQVYTAVSWMNTCYKPNLQET